MESRNTANLKEFVVQKLVENLEARDVKLKSLEAELALFKAGSILCVTCGEVHLRSGWFHTCTNCSRTVCIGTCARQWRVDDQIDWTCQECHKRQELSRHK